MNNSTNTIQCPKCQTKIEITKAMTAQVESRIREELEGEVDAKKAALDKETQRLADQGKSLAKQKAALEKAESEVDQKVKDGVEAAVAAQRAAIVAQARKKAEADLAEERQADSERITELEGKLKQSKQTELDLRKRERTLEEEKASLELNVARRVKEETDAIRIAAKKQADDEHLLKDKETQEQNAALRRQVEDLKRKLEQGSQQAQGEALELVLEDVLTRAFPRDEVMPVKKGVHGADVLQKIMDSSGLECGSILFESKNARNWSPAWLPKLREDQRDAKAVIAVLVTEAMPPDTQHIAQIDGVWICTKACVVELARALRAGLVEVAKGRQAADGKQSKAERTYEFVTGTEFRQRIAGMVEPLLALRKGLDKERAAMERIWAAREEEIKAVVCGISSLYGKFQGIVGSTTLPTLEQMDLPRLEAGATHNGKASG
ncbi:MAG: DUF2130 domain-containing protein [Phycisphaerales bacterium]|jgi:hypothetical protein